jgi:DNA repair protein RadC
MNKEKSFTIHDLPRSERPRDKLIKYGPERLTNSELLAILLRTGKKGENVIELANRILKRFKTEELPNLKYDDLKNYSGLGPAKACEIIACFELSKRLLKGKKEKIYLTPQEVWNELRDLRDNKKEHFVILYLDIRNQEIKRETISVGSLTASLVHPREVFEPAIKNYAAQVILAHNHPSGNPEPSDDDIKMTKRLKESGIILGIEVIDHIIIGKNKYFSFKDKKLL